MDPESPLQLPLRDIHLPQAPSWWPPAPGWWLLGALLLVLTAAVWFWVQSRRRRRLSAVYLARAELARLRREFTADGDSRHLLRELSVLLRRFCISTARRRDSAGLTGQDWLCYLDQGMQGQPFSTGPGRLLADGPYRSAVGVTDIEPLLQLCAARIEAAVHPGRGEAR